MVQPIKSRHEYKDNDGVEWVRVWTTPNAAVNTQNDGSKEGFMRYTQSKKGSIGDIWDASREASEKREHTHGRDEVKEKNEKEYSKKRRRLRRRKEM